MEDKAKKNKCKMNSAYKVSMMVFASALNSYVRYLQKAKQGFWKTQLKRLIQKTMLMKRSCKLMNKNITCSYQSKMHCLMKRRQLSIFFGKLQKENVTSY